MDDTFKQISAIIRETIVPVVSESARITPDALLYGTGILSFLTQSLPLAILLLTIIEITVGCRLMGGMIRMIRPDLMATVQQSCRQGFPETGSLAALAGAMSFGAAAAGGIPHYTVVLLTGVATYLVTAMIYKLDTFDALGESWQSRIPTSISLIIVIMATFIFGLLSYGCITMGNLFMSLGAGAGLGLVSFVLHNTVFGPQATNFHGVPLLLNKLTEGEAVYVCGKGI